MSVTVVATCAIAQGVTAFGKGLHYVYAHFATLHATPAFHIPTIDMRAMYVGVARVFRAHC